MNQVPKDILLDIFSFLPVKTLGKISLVRIWRSDLNFWPGMPILEGILPEREAVARLLRQIISHELQNGEYDLETAMPPITWAK